MKKLNNGYLMAFYEANITLAKTMVIKHSDIAALMNEGVVAAYGDSSVDVYQPESWKYYMNVAGEYHPTDTLMRVMSIDTLQMVDFTTENLAIHTATAKAYEYGTRYYFSLLRQYPRQEFLINGILNPADKDYALIARDGAIISYRKDLVEMNEHSLIYELENWIVNQIDRWYVTQMNMNNDLYAAVFFPLIQSKVLNKILNLRMKRCHGYEAHSFHVRMFLASHNELDRYLPFLTLKQSLWLYRNIRYVERHPGLIFQFYRLVDHLLTERGIPIGEYSIRQQDSFVNYVPETTAKSNPLNGVHNQLIDNRQPLSYLFGKEVEDAPGNLQYLNYSQDREAGRFSTAASSSVATKVLHSTMTDLTNALPETYEEIALRQWCRMATVGQYPIYVSFKDPKSSIVYTLTSLDAFFYMYYLNLRRDGLTLTEIPLFLNMRQRRHPKPTVDDLLKVVDSQHDLRLEAEAIIAAQPVIAPCFSVQAFSELIDKLYDECYRHWFIISSMEDLYERAYVESMIHQLYEDQLTEFSLGATSVNAWLDLNNLPDYDYTRDEAAVLIKAIFEAGSGYAVSDARTLKNVQRALIDLLKELSSYTIQFVREINDSDLIIIDWPAVRFGNERFRQEVIRTVETGPYVLDAPAHAKMIEFVGTDRTNRNQTTIVYEQSLASVEIDSSSEENTSVLLEISCHDLDPMMTMMITYPGQDNVYEDKLGVVGLTAFRDLPEPIKKQYMNRFSSL